MGHRKTDLISVINKTSKKSSAKISWKHLFPFRQRKYFNTSVSSNQFSLSLLNRRGDGVHYQVNSTLLGGLRQQQEQMSHARYMSKNRINDWHTFLVLVLMFFYLSIHRQIPWTMIAIIFWVKLVVIDRLERIADDSFFLLLFPLECLFIWLNLFL